MQCWPCWCYQGICPGCWCSGQMSPPCVCVRECVCVMELVSVDCDQLIWQIGDEDMHSPKCCLHALFLLEVGDQ